MKLFVIVCLLLAIANAQIAFNRTITGSDKVKGTLKFSKGCKKTDEWGSNDCTWNWKDTFDIDLESTMDKSVTGGKLNVDLTVEKVLPLKFTCPLCDANCTFVIPIIKQKVEFAMPSCADIHALTIKQTVTLPDKNPLGIGVPVTGGGSIVDQTGASLLKATVVAKVASYEDIGTLLKIHFAPWLL